MKNKNRICYWYLFVLSLCLFMMGFYGNSGSAQQTPYIDRAPTGEENIRMTRWGPQKVPIDTHTPLGELIQRLEGDWKLVFTGKTYYIGYTDDMYSIAAHKDAAIEPLLQFIHQTTSSHAKHGAVWTLHLIGIDSKIVGRFHEEFTNPNAREALLQLLSDEELRAHVMTLLMKDPWPSDVPVIIEMLKNSETYYEPLAKGLLRYPFEEMPFRQPLRDATTSLDIAFLDPEISSNTVILGKLTHLSFEKLDEEVERKSNIVTQHDSPYNTRRFWQWIPLDQIHIQALSSKYDIDLNMHLQHVINWGLSSPTYFLEGDTLYLCAPSVAKQRWLDWYEEQVAHGGPKFETHKKSE